MLKKTLAGLTAAALALSLGACGGGEDTKTVVGNAAATENGDTGGTTGETGGETGGE